MYSDWRLPESSVKYKKTGEVISKTEGGETKETTYKYDELNRNIGVIYHDGIKETFSFDGNGNIIEKLTYEDWNFEPDTWVMKEKYVFDSDNKLTEKNSVRINSKLEIHATSILGEYHKRLTISGEYSDGTKVPADILKETSWKGPHLKSYKGISVEIYASNKGNGNGNGGLPGGYFPDVKSEESDDKEVFLAPGKTIGDGIYETYTAQIGDVVISKEVYIECLNDGDVEYWIVPEETTTEQNIKIDFSNEDEKDVTTDQNIKIDFDNQIKEDPKTLNIETGPNVDSKRFYNSRYNYDNNGKLISEYCNNRIVKEFDYNSLNQLTKFENKKTRTVAAYEYYPQGLRKSKTVSNGERSIINRRIDFYYHGENVIMEEKNGNLFGKYLIGLGYIRREDSSRTPYYYFYDSHGDVTDITNSSGNIVVVELYLEVLC